LAAIYQVNAHGNVYTVVDDCTTVYLALVTGGATDEIFGALAAPGFAVELQRTDLSAKAFDNGLYALTGYPGNSFPQLATTAYTVNYVLTAPGFRDLPMTSNIPVNAIFPVPAPAAAMRRLPVRIQGRVVGSTSRLPIPGALIASVDNPASPPTVHSTVLRSPLYFTHANLSAVQTVTIAVGPGATLQQAVESGDQVITVSTRTGLAANPIVRLTGSAGVQLEYATVDHLGPGPVASPGQVFLKNALNQSYPIAGTAVDFVSATLVGAAEKLSADTDVADGVVLADALFSTTVALEAGTALEEIHEVGALSDSNGYYGFDGIGRVQELFLRATQGASKLTVDWFVQYDQPLNLVDFRL
jgi:hypothetical protein